MADNNRGGSTTNEITYYLNVENAKILAFCLVCGFVMYHGVLHLKYGNDSCKWLLSDGRFPGYNTWQPYGCMMHKYTKVHARRCMHYIYYWGEQNHITFLGDSRIRQLYFEFVNLLSLQRVEEHKAHHDLHFEDKKIRVTADFLWHPMVNSSMYDVYKNWLMAEKSSMPNLLITGSGTWSIKQFNASDEAVKNFEYNLTMILPYIVKLRDSTQIIWMLQDPVDEFKLYPNRSMITNQQVDAYNKVAIDILGGSDAKLWSSSRLVAQGIHDNSVLDGLHISKSALELDLQMLLNMYCNDHMNHNDGTCCRVPDSITSIQITTAAFFLVCLLSAIAMFLYRRKLRRNGSKARADSGIRNGRSHVTPTEKTWTDTVYEIMVCLAKLGLIMAYTFLCDRTNFFMKENKSYTHVNFLLPFAYLMILGFFFTENTDQTTVLHRDQTDEWKGWMQLVIMIYHLTGASKVLPIYMHIRVLVSAYLFLTGYGHFSYFWNKTDYSLQRYCQQSCNVRCCGWYDFRYYVEVMFRLNFLVVVLCFVMDRPYQFYYFVPLVSFWFTVVYLTLAIWPRISAVSSDVSNLHYLYMIIKFIILTTVITLFFMSEVLFEKVFLMKPIKALFVRSDDSLHEWRFRWTLDRYSVVYGMVFAFGYHLLLKKGVISDNHNNSLFSTGVSLSLTGLGFLGIGSYAIFSFLCKNKSECNDTHSYLVALPLISYVIVRNVLGWMRTRYSSFFAWFGKISLELFIAQYHIWLAADTYGVLVLMPTYPVLNVIVTSFIFICASHEISKITGILTNYLVPKDGKSLLRNAIIFFMIMLPISVSKGVLSF
ncbi:N-acetylneuraminate 9-O-acetyltransferase-like isoform X1 [Ostrea edulis]|uniref:N-acetylneuraminate 9-O-acetyltransferase-like isoform X1 n=1 Tax=Ostrea edulis TaxID=37623 RepID=UPI0024AF8737|nr:N-acetylneuraminate 9-O-acetyltransferase-like isoform X1 [Ostrea edulis]